MLISQIFSNQRKARKYQKTEETMTAGDECCFKKGSTQQNDLDTRKRIQDVRKDQSLSQVEKNMAIQNIMMGGRFALPCSTAKKMKSPIHAPNNALMCKHYSKTCSRFDFSCCGTTDPCHRCHLERGCDVTPPQVESVMCNSCNLKQPPGRVCINEKCKKAFAANHCNKCMVWTQVDIHHCHECGLCRVGKEKGLFHCKKCEACFHVSTKDSHVCTVLSMKLQSCPLCLEATHSSQRRCMILLCGHVGHYDCLQKAWTHDRGMIPKCPTCRKSLLKPESMKVYWNAVRASIESQPLTSEVMSINIGDQVSSPYGFFIIDRIVEQVKVPDTCHPILSASDIYHGRLIDWKMKDGKFPTAALQLKCLKKDLQVTITCNDCEKRSHSNFHFLGMECGNCHGFNTAQI